MDADKAPPSGRRPDGQAFDILFSDLVERIMSLADTPDRCVAFIAEELRSLVGVRSVFVYECPGLTGKERHRLVSFLPERRRGLGEDIRMNELAELTHGFEDVFFIEPQTGDRMGELLRELGVGESLAIPLRYASKRVGVVLLLDIMEKANIGTILDTLGRLSGILALILRNAWLYENLEEAVTVRTAELEAKRAELAASLAEKEVMLKEIHHRVKNNLQIVNSLLYLSMSAVTDPETRRLFAESQSRIMAMALVHEELYISKDLASVDMADYVTRLADRLMDMAPPGVSAELRAEPIGLAIDVAIPCGLVLNELLLNAFKHAYLGRSSGSLKVAFRREGKRIVLEVEDDGPGLPATGVTAEKVGLGMSIVQSLTDQLKGSFDVLPGPGGRFRLTFSPSAI